MRRRITAIFSKQPAGNLLRARVSLHFLASGHDALQFARRWRAGLWVVNSKLNDMSGFALAQTLRSTRPSALIFLLGDEYCPADESQTLAMGVCQVPLQTSGALLGAAPGSRVVYSSGGVSRLDSPGASCVEK